VCLELPLICSHQPGLSLETGIQQDGSAHHLRAARIDGHRSPISPSRVQYSPADRSPYGIAGQIEQEQQTRQTRETAGAIQTGGYRGRQRQEAAAEEPVQHGEHHDSGVTGNERPDEQLRETGHEHGDEERVHGADAVRDESHERTPARGREVQHGERQLSKKAAQLWQLFAGELRQVEDGGQISECREEEAEAQAPEDRVAEERDIEPDYRATLCAWRSPLFDQKVGYDESDGVYAAEYDESLFVPERFEHSA